jgi:hypothetical protein
MSLEGAGKMNRINITSELDAEVSKLKLASVLTATELLNIIRPHVDGFLVSNKPIKDFTLFLSLEGNSSISKAYNIRPGRAEGAVAQLDQVQTTAIFNAIKEVVQLPGLVQELRVEIPMDGALPKFECVFYGKPSDGPGNQVVSDIKKLEPGMYTVKVGRLSHQTIVEFKHAWEELNQKQGHKYTAIVMPDGLELSNFSAMQFGFSIAMRVMQAGRWVKRPSRPYALTIRDGKLTIKYDEAAERELSWLCTEDIIANDYVMV